MPGPYGGKEDRGAVGHRDQARKGIRGEQGISLRPQIAAQTRRRRLGIGGRLVPFQDQIRAKALERPPRSIDHRSLRAFDVDLDQVDAAQSFTLDEGIERQRRDGGDGNVAVSGRAKRGKAFVRAPFLRGVHLHLRLAVGERSVHHGHVRPPVSPHVLLEHREPSRDRLERDHAASPSLTGGDQGQFPLVGAHVEEHAVDRQMVPDQLRFGERVDPTPVDRAPDVTRAIEPDP